jgi:16S rRNA (adenine1518-N6/adenine1519-N6)-dimethyltransferase
MRLNEMREVLQARQIQLTRSLGQNFLHDANQLRKIVRLAALEPEDAVLEIGPGLGPLTEQLLARAGRVLCVEKDQRLVRFLQERFGSEPRLQVIQADALDWLQAEPRDWQAWKMVSNLPYSVGSPILVELALAPRPPARMVVTLQWEVVQRLQAGPGDPDYGLLSVLVQARFDPAEHFKIPAGCFFPEPDIDSGCLRLERRAEALVPEAARGRFLQVAKRAFSQRRKMMFKVLKADWPEKDLEPAFAAAGLRRDARAETVSVGQFAILARELNAHV